MALMESNNREVAWLIWLVIILVFALSKDSTGEIRRAFKAVLRSFFVKFIVLIFLAATLWISTVVYVLAWLDLWSMSNLKTTLIWGITFAGALLFKLQRFTGEDKFLKQILGEILNFTAIIAFIAEMYSHLIDGRTDSYATGHDNRFEPRLRPTQKRICARRKTPVHFACYLWSHLLLRTGYFRRAQISKILLPTKISRILYPDLSIASVPAPCLFGQYRNVL